MGLINFIKNRRKNKTVKLGLALGSGGAKGLAHLGALKVFEEEGLKFDIVTGTSIGSIVGAMYARGYSSTDIMQLLKTVSFGEVLRPVMVKMDMSNAQKVLDKLVGGLDIEELTLPYAAVATDVATGEEVVFKSGSVALAASASSSMPPFFKPVTVDGKQLMDGAFVNPVPASVAREMGAGFVVGVDLSAHKMESYEGVIEGDGEINPDLKARKKGYEHSDIMLKPDLRNFKATSIFKMDEMYDAGYEEAKSKMPAIKQLLKDAGYKFE